MPQMYARTIVSLVLAAATGACASTGAVPRPFPMPGGKQSAAPATNAPGTTAPGTPDPGTVAPGTTAPSTVAPGTLAPPGSDRISIEDFMKVELRVAKVLAGCCAQQLCRTVDAG